ncbi:glycosyltransferase [candidate division WWE3 bacterium]|nr:glycosyltransferase [candidate division WWE3 bacterium]
MLVSVIVPAYKKQGTIRKNIENIYGEMSRTRHDFEIIVVVDGYAVDKTLEEARKIRKKNVLAIGYGDNRGKGYAVRYGMARAKGDVIAFIDAGMEIDANGISMILEHMQWYDADIIVGSKRHQASKVKSPFIRKLYSYGYYFGVKLLFWINVRDTQTGLKVYKREVLEKVLPRLVVKRFAFDIELLAVARHLGFKRIYEAPINIDLSKDYDESTFKHFLFFDPYVRGVLVDTLGVFYRLRLLRYYDDGSVRKWSFDKELKMKVNTGAFERLGKSAFVGKSVRKTKEDIKFSIIITVRSIGDFLRESISYIKELSYSNFEVLVVLDKNEDFDFEDDRFKVVESGAVGPGRKRNLGASCSVGNVLVFLDDDAYPSRGWLNEAASILADKDIYALGAPALTPPGAGILEKGSGRIFESWLAGGGTTHRYLPLAGRYVDDYPTVNLFVRKDAFFSVGGFTEEFWPGEDTKLCLDLVKKFGSAFVYDPAPAVFHHRRNLFRPHLRQISRYGMHRGQFAKIFPGNSRQFSYFVPALFVLGLVLGPATFGVSLLFAVAYSYILTFYFGLVVYESVKVMLSDRSMRLGFLVGVGIFLTHIVYGACFLIGFVRRPKLKLKSFDLATGNYVEG